MNKQKIKQQKQSRRKGRVRVKVSGTRSRPRLSVFKSSKSMYLQLIDDEKGETLVSVHSKEVKQKDVLAGLAQGKKVVICFELGKLIARKALDPAKNKTGKKIKKVIFDRSGYKYHGRVKAAANGAREGGLEF